MPTYPRPHATNKKQDNIPEALDGRCIKKKKKEKTGTRRNPNISP
jgi:hypothetical protein